MTPPAKTIPVAKTPAVVGIYGVPKLGKTTDILASCPRTFFFARPAALKPSEGLLGFSLSPDQIWYTNRIKAMTAYLPKIAASKAFDAVAADDFSIAAEETYAQVKAEYRGKNAYEPWTLLRQEVIDFISAARDCGLHVIMNMHEAPPKTKNMHTFKGGPALPTDLQEKVPALIDTVLRAVVAPGRLGWPVAYRCSVLDETYITGDRHGVTPDMAPMNIGEILRMAGFALRRAPGLEWLDDVVERIATTLIQATTPQQEQEVVRGAVAWLQQNVTQDLRHIGWALRDGIDRTALRRARSNVLSYFFTPQGQPGGGLTLG